MYKLLGISIYKFWVENNYFNSFSASKVSPISQMSPISLVAAPDAVPLPLLDLIHLLAWWLPLLPKGRIKVLPPTNITVCSCLGFCFPNGHWAGQLWEPQLYMSFSFRPNPELENLDTCFLVLEPQPDFSKFSPGKGLQEQRKREKAVCSQTFFWSLPLLPKHLVFSKGRVDTRLCAVTRLLKISISDLWGEKAWSIFEV